MSNNDLYDFERKSTIDRFMMRADRELLKKFYEAYWDCIENAYMVTGWNYSFETERDDKVYELISEMVIDSLSWDWH